MDAWIDIRRKARECRAKAVAAVKGAPSAVSIVNAYLEAEDIELRPYGPGTIVNEGVLGSLDRKTKILSIVNNLKEPERLVVLAHEIGHFVLHHDETNEVTVRRAGLGGDPVSSGAGKVEGYSPRERKEVQADIFAGEFLCPSDWLRAEYLKGRRPDNIAAELGLPPALVMNQTIRALLLPPLRASRAPAPAPVRELDESQKIAATWDEGPLLVDAGPGTGKTRTLVERINFLLERKALPGSILALTFSNKAAEEMRERLSAMNADAAIEMWAGTFHAFGLELITKWPSSIGRTGKVRVLDEAGSLALLEDNLERLPLDYYQNLYEPALDLIPVLQQISRCKDEMIAPPVYRAAAEADLAAARASKDGDAEEAAEKALEVAAIYEVYQQLLAEEDAVDFGDLVLHAVDLVRTNPGVKTQVAKYRHVLVDEYQDVNLASAELLRAIRATGAGIWVVADQRQSIYRFRGAEPANVARFVVEFGGARHSLDCNYRSVPPVVRTFESFSASMGDGDMAGHWSPRRTGGNAVTMTTTPDVAAEGEALRDKIEEFRNAGVPYGDQAILARSHLTLARITAVLEQLGVPLLYLGDLFERDEIRDLLSLVGLNAEYGNVGLVRIAKMPNYRATKEDALQTIKWARENKLSIFDALKRAGEIEGVSATGCAGLLRLGGELDGLETASPWVLLTTWLFRRSDYLAPLLAANDPASQQKLIAIYQLLKTCGEQGSRANYRRKTFLAKIRRLERLNQDSSYRAISSEASDMDAVRVMTVHSSKGLEFGAVHIPALATKYLPATRQGGVRCHPPSSLSHLEVQPRGHDDEEECVFFVALSRARDHLSLSRADRYAATQTASPSKFLPKIASVISTAHYQGSGRDYSPPAALAPQMPREAYPERELGVYFKCPARYRYEAIDGLWGMRDDSAYVAFHRCVYATVGWLEQQRQDGTVADVAQGLARLAAVWAEKGPLEHAFEPYYRAAAERMVRTMVGTIATETGQYDRQEWIVDVGPGKVSITPDRVILTSDGSVRIQRIRTGKKSKSETSNEIYALLRKGAALKYPGKPVSIETYYLATAEVIPVLAKNDAKKLEEYADAIRAIEAGQFGARQSRDCPNCQCYFMCGA